MKAEIDDTFAEGFDGFCSEVLVTAKNRKWLDAAVYAAVGCATSCIGCGCEAGVDVFLESEETPDKRVGAALQFWVSSFNPEPVKQLEHELIHRIGQCVLTSPTSAVWNFTDSAEKLPVGRKIGFFADGFQFEEQWFGRTVVNVPRMMGDFLIEKELGFVRGVMGGNLWFFASSEDSALEAAEHAVSALSAVKGVVASFPGGVCASGSKIGSKYKFLKASTNHLFCPSLAGVVDDSQVPEGVHSISEVVFNGLSLSLLQDALLQAVDASRETEGLLKVSAGNYGGKLGRHKIFLHP